MRIVVSSLDQAGNPLMFHDTIVNIEVVGAADLIGPKTIVLKGSTSAFWIRTKGLIGTAKVSVTSSEGQHQAIEISVK